MSNSKTERKKKKFISIFEKKVCNIKQTCKAVGITRQTYYNWMKEDPDFAQEVTDVEESLYDDIESKMYKKAIIEEDNTMLIFIAKTKMRDRGYSERIQFENKNVDEFQDDEEKIRKELEELRKKRKDSESDE